MNSATQTTANTKTPRRAVHGTVRPLVGLPPVLDACCGPRGFWFDRHDSRAVYVDARRETVTMHGEHPCVIDPDHLADFTNLPFPSDTFALVVFDPPHIQREKLLGNITKRYGALNGDWREMLRKGFAECFRVLRPEGVLVFKWSSVQFPLREILALTPERPLFGHQTGKQMNTHWVAFLKPNSAICLQNEEYQRREFAPDEADKGRGPAGG